MNHAAAAIPILEGVCRTTMGFMLHACYGVFGQRRGIGGLRAQGSVRARLKFCKENRYIHRPIKMFMEGFTCLDFPRVINQHWKIVKLENSMG